MTHTNEGITRRAFSGLAIGAVATSALALAGCSGGPKSLSKANVADLEKALGRKVATPASGEAYDSARYIWNELFDARPTAIAPCETAKDVAHCIAFARKNGLPLSVRSGGHHPAGLAMKDGGLVIDLSAMKAVTVDPKTRRATVAPGVFVAELDSAAAAHKLAVPTAAFPTVGLGGMALGGGEGWLGEFGLTLDNIVSAEMVLADGRIVRVDERTEPDLYWAIRGGGGNFGVVTSIELQAHPLQDLMVGMKGFPFERAADVGMKIRDHSLAAAPDFASKMLFVRNPAPAMLVAAKTARPMNEAQAEFAALRALGPAMPDMVRPIGLDELQAMAAANAGSGNRYFAQTLYFKDVSPQLFDMTVAAIKAAPSADASIVVHTLSEGIAKIPVDATAYPHRGVRFSIQAQSRWADKKDDERNIGWVKDWWQKTVPLSTGEVYANYISETGPGMAKRAYGLNYPRLAQIKKRYDPENVFSSAINIIPA